MSGQRMDVCVVTKYADRTTGEEKSRWNRVGVAFENRLGGFNVKLDGPTVIIPGVNDLVIVPPKEQNGGGGGRSSGGGQRGGGRQAQDDGGFDGGPDDIPF